MHRAKAFLSSIQEGLDRAHYGLLLEPSYDYSDQMYKLNETPFSFEDKEEESI